MISKLNHFTLIESDTLIETITNAKEELGFTLLLDITAIDNLNKSHTTSSRFELIYILRHCEFKDTVTYKVSVLDEKIGVPTLSSLFSSAEWAEREIYDQYGIHFQDHKMLKRLLNHNEFVGHPLRKDYEITKGQYCTTSQDLMDEMRPLLNERNLDMSRDDLMVVNLGPSHPASHGTIRTLAALDGEKIVAAACEIGYLHRGFEKSCENHNYNQIIPYTDRLNYCSAIMNNIAFAKTVEEMLDITLPDRGIFIRVIVAELSRVIDHLVCLAAGLLDMGGQTNYWYLYNPRDNAYDFLSKLTGARLTNSYMRIGGMTHDLYDGWETDLADVLTKIDYGISESLKMITHNRIYNDRIQNVSPVSAAQAIDYGFTGPNLRASGVAHDLRFSNPYYYYDTFDFNMVIGSVGDTYDRMMVRFDEMNESLKIIRQAVKRIPDGDINVSDKRIIMPGKGCVYGGIEGMMNQFKLVVDGVKVPEGEHYGSFEAANGELGFYIVSDGSGTPYKVKVRPPSFYHMAAYPKIIEKYQVADAIMTLGSLNIIAGEMDR
ncbi:MAG: NADH-quinone oxidoreductase subunit D [Sulfurovum sp.]|uniref:NADH-quinone oxidoreductase subunit D n=1 Tax=Sulfurovum sp. TaxID=1969726 RepID=UPI002868203B|nr:NADH-quinone oxidoreductase subunit D [Sulfurovum sp.]MCO4844701.1 NADH-quinone oxidoreductase subunit D [Sulfurovum sp.]